MRWQIDGAESATGREISLTLEAATAEEAEQKARYNGILVSRVSKATAPKPAAAPLHGFDKPVAPSSTPEYRDILTGSKILNSFAWLAMLIGWLCIGLGAVPVVFALWQMPKDESWRDRADTLKLSLALLVLSILYGVACFLVAAFIRMQASMAIALRDIARNSFKR